MSQLCEHIPLLAVRYRARGPKGGGGGDGKPFQSHKLSVAIMTPAMSLMSRHSSSDGEVRSFGVFIAEGGTAVITHIVVLFLTDFGL